MTWRARRPVAVAVVLLVVLAPVLGGVAAGGTATPASRGTTLAPTPIDTCTVIDTSGVYALTASISDNSTTTCIDIRASDVTLLGRGYTIDGVDRTSPGGGLTRGVWANVDQGGLTNVTVRNLTVTRWGVGVQFGEFDNPGVDDGAIRGVTATANGVGIDLTASSGNTIADTVAERNAFEGMEVSGSNNVVRDSTARNNDFAGFELFGDGTTVEGNVARDNGGKGFSLGGGVDAVVDNVAVNNSVGIDVGASTEVRNNEVRDSRGDGIFVFGDDNRILSNTVRNSADAGIAVRGANNVFENNVLRNGDVGVRLPGGDDNRFRDTRITGSAVTAVAARPRLIETTYDNATNNSFVGLDLGYADATLSFILTDATVGRVRASAAPATPSGKTDIGVYVNATRASPRGFVDLTVNYDASVEPSIVESTLSVWRHDGGWSDVGGRLDTTGNTVGKNVTSFSVFAPLADAPTAEFSVALDGTNSPVVEGEELAVTATVSNTGTDGGTATVSLRVGGTKRDSRRVTLAAGETTTVTLGWATADGDAGNYTATVAAGDDADSAPVTVRRPANFSVRVDGTTSPVTAGERVNVTATVTNTGTASGTGTVTLSLGGRQRDATSVTLDTGENRTVTLGWTTAEGDAGNYTATVATRDDADSAPVTVRRPANFSVAVDGSNSPVVEGDRLAVTGTVTNTGGSTGTGTVTLSVGGRQRDATSVSLDPGENTTLTLGWATTEGDSGNYTARVATPDDGATTAVRLLESAEFSVTVDGSNSPVTAGNELTVTATVENTGEVAGTRSVTLSVGGRQRDAAQLTLGPGETRTVTLGWATTDGDSGNYTARVATGDDAARTGVRVLRPATFSVSVDGSNSPVTAGNELTVTATVENTGDVGATQSVTLSVGGSRRDATPVTLGPGENRTVTLTWATADAIAGTFTATVASENDTATAPLRVLVGGGPSGPANTPPTVAIDYAPGSPGVDRTVEFAALANDSDGTVERYEWRVDGEVVSTERTLGYAFGSSGAHEVTLRVVDDDGAASVTSVTVDVNRLPTVDIRTNTTRVEVGGAAALRGVATDPDGAVVRIEWRVDGEIVGEGPGLVYRFGSAGEHRVTATAVDDDGGTATAAVTVRAVANIGPTVAIGYAPASPNVSEAVEFRAAADDVDGTVQRYEWRVDGEVVSTDRTFDYTFELPGPQTLSLRVVDDDGAVNETSVTVEVNAPPEASIQASSTTPTVNGSVSFTADVSDPNDDVERYEWRVDGEVVSTGPSFDYTFESPGTHEVTLRIVDDDGARTIASQTVEVRAKTAATTAGTGQGLGVGGLTGLLLVLLVVLAALVVLFALRGREEAEK